MDEKDKNETESGFENEPLNEQDKNIEEPVTTEPDREEQSFEAPRYDEKREQSGGMQEPYQPYGYGSYYGQYYGGSYPPPRYDPNRRDNGLPPPYNPQPQRPKVKKAPIIAACTLLVVFICAISFIFGYVYLEHIRPIIDGAESGGVINGGGSGSGNGEGGTQGGGAGVSSDSILQEGFDISQPDAPGTAYQSLSDAYDATHRSFVEINTITKDGSVGAGSGVIIARMSGNVGYYIVTNNHVVEDYEKITVKAYCGDEYKTYTAHTHVLTDEMTDLAVIAIMETGNMQVAKIGRSSKLRVGESIYVIGNPLGTLAGTLTDGIISSQAVEIFVGDHYMQLLQTNAAINPGNSGGPMFNMAGEVVGIVNAKYADVSVEGIGFAIPIDIALSVAEQMISKGYVEGRHDLGISVEYGYYGAGLWITGIDADSALRDTDLTISNVYAYRIESMDGYVFESTSEANIYIDSLKAGNKVKMNITVYEVYFGQLRKTGTKQITVTLGQRSATAK